MRIFYLCSFYIMRIYPHGCKETSIYTKHIARILLELRVLIKTQFFEIHIKKEDSYVAMNK